MHVNVNYTALYEILTKVAASSDYLYGLYNKVAMLVDNKNHDYGDAWQRFGVYTPLIRLNDKILRVATLSDGRQALVNAESIEDTLIDIIGYAALALLWLDLNERKSNDSTYQQLDFGSVCADWFSTPKE